MVNELNRDDQRHLFVQTDVADASSVENMIKVTMATYGRIDVLVNNTGISIPRLLVDPKDPGGNVNWEKKYLIKQ